MVTNIPKEGAWPQCLVSTQQREQKVEVIVIIGYVDKITTEIRGEKTTAFCYFEFLN